jgi:hypothetical protein
MGLLLLEIPILFVSSKEMNFRELVAGVKSRLIEVQENYGLPLEEIVKHVSLRGQLPNVLVNLVSEFSSLLPVREQPSALYDKSEDFALTPTGLLIERELIFQLYVRDNSITGMITYATDLFTADSIGNLKGYLDVICRRAATDAEFCLSEFGSGAVSTELPGPFL